MSKHVGTAKEKQEERHKRRKAGLEGVVSSVMGKVDKFTNEWAEKFNKLGHTVDGLLKMTVSELGKVGANEQQLVESIDHVDLNVLALAELSKKMYVRILDAKNTPGVPPEELEKVALEMAKEDTKEAFSIVLKRRQEENEAKKAAREAALAEQKKAAEDKAEAENVESALLAAESERKIEPVGTGGQGADFPEGAQIFGGA